MEYHSQNYIDWYAIARSNDANYNLTHFKCQKIHDDIRFPTEISYRILVMS